MKRKAISSGCKRAGWSVKINRFNRCELSSEILTGWHRYLLKLSRCKITSKSSYRINGDGKLPLSVTAQTDCKQKKLFFFHFGSKNVQWITLSVWSILADLECAFALDWTRIVTVTDVAVQVPLRPWFSGDKFQPMGVRVAAKNRRDRRSWLPSRERNRSRRRVRIGKKNKTDLSEINHLEQEKIALFRRRKEEDLPVSSKMARRRGSNSWMEQPNVWEWRCQQAQESAFYLLNWL